MFVYVCSFQFTAITIICCHKCKDANQLTGNQYGFTALCFFVVTLSLERELEDTHTHFLAIWTITFYFINNSKWKLSNVNDKPLNIYYFFNFLI